MNLLDEEYQLLKLIGSGASGLVYLAQHLESDELVAVKEFSATRESTSHFLKELSTLFTLQHPNVVECKNLIYGGMSKSYLVMEYADGGSLRKKLEAERPMLPRECVAILRDILQGLHSLHENSIIHCDLKPENILIFEAESERPIYKITDLGIAQIRTARETKETAGSPLYMAPEQFYDVTTEASDIYSLGAVFFEMLTGDFLFEGEPDQLFTSHLNSEPELEKIDCPRSREFCEILLSKSPSERPRNASQALYELDRIFERSVTIESVPENFESLSEKSDKKPVQFTFTNSSEVPGAKHLLAGSRDQVLISRHSGTDLLELSKGITRPLYFVEAFTHELSLHDGRKLFFAKPWLSRLEGANRLRPLFRPQTQIKALAALPKDDCIVYTDGRKLCCSSILGEQLWSTDLPNYFLEPQILVSQRNQSLFVTSGPSTPHIREYNFKGELLRTLPLPAPCFALSHQDGKLLAYVLPIRGQTNSRLLRLEDNDWLEVSDLGHQVCRARAGPEIQLLLAPNGVLVQTSENLQSIFVPCTGTPFEALWMSASNTLLLLSQSGGQTFLHRYESTAQTNLARQKKEH